MILAPILIFAAAQAETSAEPTPQRAPTPIVLGPPAPPSPTPFTPKAARPRGDQSKWLRNSDYPKELHGGESGVTGFRLVVGTDGKPIRCDITFASGHPALDARVCELMMLRAQFEPARDGYNRKRVGYYSNRVRWNAPAPQQAPSS